MMSEHASKLLFAHGIAKPYLAMLSSAMLRSLASASAKAHKRVAFSCKAYCMSYRYSRTAAQLTVSIHPGSLLWILAAVTLLYWATATERTQCSAHSKVKPAQG